MLRILIILFIGMLIGYFCAGKKFTHYSEQGIKYAVFVLLFVFGISIGSNSQIILHVWEVGGQALTIALLGMVGSLIASYLAQRYFLQKGGKK